MKELSIDIETFSEVDLKKSGVYRYSEDDSFELLLFGVSIDNGPVHVYDVTKEEIPEEILQALVDDAVIKWAFNASFERICLSNWLKKHYPQLLNKGYLSPISWRCSMIWSAYLGLPLSLEGVGTMLKLKDQKLKSGADLIRYFCLPCKPTKTNGGRERNYPHHASGKWADFVLYNKRDVEVELAIKERLKKFPVPDFVWKEYHEDQRINDRGIAIDSDFVKAAISIDEQSKAQIHSKLTQLTGLDNPNSVLQMIGWLRDHGVMTDSLDKKAVNELLKTVDEDTAAVLKLRQQAAKSSVTKYKAMMNCVCKDERVHGMFQFYGANRTGRWCGKLVQIQNLPRNILSDLKEARNLVKTGDLESVELLYDTQDTLSQLIRTAFIPHQGKKFIVCDFSAIEARVLSHLAGETWRSQVFESGKDIYCMSASQMFGVPVEKHGVNAELRQKGKIAELACIAEGQLVLMDSGLVPIEQITTSMNVWDGVSWVNHQGVIYKGEREVITYDGLTATSDHLVWVEGQSEPIPFGEAASSSAYLLQTGDGRRAIRLGEDYQSRKSTNDEPLQMHHRCKTKVYDMRNAGPHHRFTVSGKLVHNCGYGGSVGALKAMGALDMGLQEEELQPLVTSWRQANPHITLFWWDVDKAIKTAIKEGYSTEVKGIQFEVQSGMLIITLPSGRQIFYVKPKIGENDFGGESVTYEGTGTAKRWERIESYGPKFVENIVQAISRDILAYAIHQLKDYRIVGHVHDEVIIECDAEDTIEVIATRMSVSPPWMKDILLRADGYECEFYQKD